MNPAKASPSGLQLVTGEKDRIGSRSASARERTTIHRLVRSGDLVISVTRVTRGDSPRRKVRATLAVGAITAMGLVGGIAAAPVASAASVQAPVGLGTATSFAVLAGAAVTNTGPSMISGDLGVSPGSAVTGFPPGLVSNGTIHAADAVAAQAQADLTTAYNDAAGRGLDP